MNRRELEVLDIVCAAGQPVTSSEIVSRKEGLTQSTVISVLRKLETKKAVRISGLTHSGKVLSRLYEPGEKAKEVVKEYYLENFRMTQSILPPEEMVRLIQHFQQQAGGIG